MAKKSKPSRGLQARGSRGGARERLARAAGFRSDAEIAALFPAGRQKQVRQLQQALAQLVNDVPAAGLSGSPLAGHYAGLMRALADPAAPPPPPAPAPAAEEPAAQRARKQASLAAEGLRQLVLEAVETPLAMLPSLLADPSLSATDKLSRLNVYTAALESLYEPLDLEPIGDPGEATRFDGRQHECAGDLAVGAPCTIRHIGFRRGDTVLRKAVVSPAD